jgi:hypothetical protein
MALSELQFTVLFSGAFGTTIEDLGGTLDTTGDVPVAKKGSKVVSLLVINDRGIEWQVNGTAIGVPFSINGRDSVGNQAQQDAREKLTAALG